MMKDVGQDWCHVLCALTSNKITLQSYLTLNFAISGPQNKPSKYTKCIYCHSDKTAGLACRIDKCKTYIHLGCVV